LATPPPLSPLNRVCFSWKDEASCEVAWPHIAICTIYCQDPCKLIITVSRHSNWTEVQLSIEFPIDKISYWQSHFQVVATSSLPCSKSLLATITSCCHPHVMPMTCFIVFLTSKQLFSEDVTKINSGLWQTPPTLYTGSTFCHPLGLRCKMPFLAIM